MGEIYPVYHTMEECLDKCGSFVSNCSGAEPQFVCQLNIHVFLLVILIAIVTGILIPVSCLLLWVYGGCRKSKNPDECSLFSRNRPNNRMGKGNEDERSSLFPSSPPTLQIPACNKTRNPSSFSLPAVSHDVILEESESAENVWKNTKRCRKITFDLSMSNRVNEFAHL